jgi:hypothetical protein
VLRQEDTKLVPKDGTIEPTVAQAWITTWVNQLLADQDFRRRGLKVTEADRTAAKKSVEQVFRGSKVFAAFPEDFRERAIEREARTAALARTFPSTHEPTDADLLELWAPVGRTCQDEKLIALIYLDTEAEANDVAAQLAAGADFATLAREHSTDTSAENGGVAMCIGSVRFGASQEPVKEAARATPIGGTSAPVKASDGYAIVRSLPLTFENARPLLADDWHQKHPTPFYDYLAAQKADAKVTIDERFARVVPAGETIVIQPTFEPVRL